MSLVLARGLANYGLELNPGHRLHCAILLSTPVVFSYCSRRLHYCRKDSIVGLPSDLVPDELPVSALWFSHSVDSLFPRNNAISPMIAYF